MKSKSLPILLFAFFFLTLSPNTFGQTRLSRFITTDQTWTEEGSPYIITQNTLIDTGATITVMPGVVINGDSQKSLTLTIGGEMLAIGTPNKQIVFEEMTLSVGDKVRFEYCRFGNLEKKKAITMNRGTTLPIKHCEFENFNINLGGVIDSCTFWYGNITMYGGITNCYFKEARIGLRGKCLFEGNRVDHLWSFGGDRLLNAVVTCNRFHVSREGISFPLIDNTTWGDTFHLEFSYNTMDSFSFEHGVGRPAMITLGNSGYHPGIPNAEIDVRFHHNNFLRNVLEVDKVRVLGYNRDIKTSRHIDFKYNYWGSADTNVVDAFIGDDYLDDFNNFATIDYKPILTKYDTTCHLAKSSCKASYYLAQDTTDKFNLFVLNNSIGVTANTVYTWSFGDGTTSNSRKPKHRYKDFGLYELCLTIEDQSVNCYHTFCDSIGVDSLGRLLKAEDGFTINIVDEKDFLHAPTFSAINDFKVYPNPSSGMVNVNLDLVGAEMVDLKVLNSTGQLVLSRRELLNAGSQEVTIDLSNEANGLYFIQTQVGRETRTSKIIKKN